MAAPTLPLQPSSSALFVDFENVYYFFRKRLVGGDSPLGASIETLRRLKTHLKEHYDGEPIILLGYGDFDRLEDSTQTQLALTGIEPRFVVGTEHKNAADMQLCIDAVSTLHVRNDVRGFVIVAGDRDYIPVIRYLKSQGRDVLVTGFRDATSGDLLEILGDDSFFDLTELIEDEYSLKSTEEIRAAERQEIVRRAEIASRPIQPSGQTKAFNSTQTTEDAFVLSALSLMLRNYGDKPDVWVSPYLHKLRQELPQLAEFERKAILTTMEQIGAVRVEQREGEKDGEPVTYSVMVINWDHPNVQDLNI